MGKTVLFCAAFLFFTACHHQVEQKPDADRVIKDTLAQIILRPFNEPPEAPVIYAQIQVSEPHFLCARNAAITELMGAIKSPPQHYLINPSVPNNIEASHGAIISIPPDCFVDKQGGIVRSPVEISVKECYGPGNMLVENIATATDDYAIESQIAVLIGAVNESGDLKLKNDKTINITLPFLFHNNLYRVFYGSGDNPVSLGWGEAPDARVLNKDSIALDKQFVKPLFSLNGLGVADYLQEIISYSDDARSNELSQTVQVSFVVNEDGSVGQVSTNECYKTFKTEISEVMVHMPKWKPASYNGVNIPCVLHMDIDFNLHRADQVRVDFKENETTLLPPDAHALSTTNNKNESNGQTSFTCHHLGWLCVGKYAFIQIAKADVIVPDDAGCSIKLMMRNRNIIASGENCIGYTRFKSLPVGSNIYFVATKKEGAQSYYAIQALCLKKQNIVSLAWKKGDVPAIQKALRSI